MIVVATSTTITNSIIVTAGNYIVISNSILS